MSALPLPSAKQRRDSLRYHIDNSPLGIIECDEHLSITRWSRQAERTFGWRAEEMCGTPLDSLVFMHPDDRATASEAFSRLMSGEQIHVNFVTRCLTRDERPVWCEWFISAESGSDSRLTSALCLVLDITERKNSEFRFVPSEEFLRRVTASSRREPLTPEDLEQNPRTEQRTRDPGFGQGGLGSRLELTEHQQLIENSERRFREAFDQAPIGMALCNLEGQFLHVNRALCLLLGYDRGELLHLSFKEVVHPDDLERDRERIRTLLRQEITSFSSEMRYQRKSLDYVWVRVTATLRRDDSDAPFQVIGIIEDITAQRNATEALEERARILDAILEFVPQGVMIARAPDIRLERVSRYGLTLSGKDPRELMSAAKDNHAKVWGMYHADGVTPASSQDLPLTRAVMAGETVRNEEWVMEARDGRRVPILANAGPVFDKAHNVIGGIAVFTDISDRKRAEQERLRLLDGERAARTEAERQSRLKDEFLAVLSHELRTPLNAVLGWAQVLRRPGRASEEWQKGIEVIERNARNQAQLIDDLLDMSRLVSGKVRLEICPVDIVSLVESAADSLQHAAESKRIHLHVRNACVSAIVKGDQARLQQIILNLLTNALKFTPEGGRVSVHTRIMGGVLELSVTDTGQGIPPHFLPHVFDRFRQADSSTTRTHGGLGLGLSIVKRLVELHGGAIRALSEGEGKGSSFLIALPLAPADAQASVQYSTATAVGVDLRGLTVVVVDDEPDASDWVKRILEDVGAHVVCAHSAEAGFQAVLSHRPALLISDIGMPREDGYSLIQRIRSLDDRALKSIPAMALSALARPEERTRALLFGYQLHRAKPIEANDLLTSVLALREGMLRELAVTSEANQRTASH